MNATHTTSKRAFTLIELIVGIVIIGVLAGVIVVAYNLFIQHSRETAAYASTHQVIDSIQARTTTNQTVPGTFTASDNPQGGEIPFSETPFAQDFQAAGISKIRISPEGDLVVVASNLVCDGVTLDQVNPGATATGELKCTSSTTPGAPLGLTATPGDTKVELSWVAPATPVAGYQVEYSIGDGPWTQLNTYDGLMTQAAVEGLENGTNYKFRVAGISLNTLPGDPGAYSTVVNATPLQPLSFKVLAAPVTAQAAVTGTAENPILTFTPGPEKPAATIAAVGGTGKKTYTLSGPVPAGVTFNSATGTITGPNSTGSDATGWNIGGAYPAALTWSVTDLTGTKTVTITLQLAG